MSELINKLKAEKKVRQIGRQYYIMKIDGSKLNLGNDISKVEKELSERDNGKLLTFDMASKKPPIENLQAPLKNSSTDTPSIAETPQKTVTSNNKVNKYGEIAKHLGNIRDLEPFADAEDMLVLINGIDSNYHDKLKDCPFVVCWRYKSKNVKDGTQPLRNKDYRVIDKNWNDISDIIKVGLDETPDGPHFTNGEMILCMTPREYYFKKKERRRLSRELAELKAEKARREQMNKSAKMTDAEKYTAELEGLNEKEWQKEKESRIENKQDSEADIKEVERQLKNVDSNIEDY